jgi:nicotinate-nucleotide pyrophosphorylase (carboxylating)
MKRPGYLTDQAIKEFIQAALAEDIGEGDHSTVATIPPGKTSGAKLLVKANGIIAGVELAEKIFLQIDPTLRLTFFKKDGDAIADSDIAFEVYGEARSILSAERLVLNCMQRMSGIATFTQRLAKIIEGTSAKLMDTRKTTPNFRLAEKWAVTIGGGTNHRFALYDMIMLKDNHIDVAGGISTAVKDAVSYLKEKNKKLKIEVETRNLKEVREALSTNAVDVILLDNMPLDEMKKAVKLINGKCKTEASGGITEVNLRLARLLFQTVSGSLRGQMTPRDVCVLASVESLEPRFEVGHSGIHALKLSFLNGLKEEGANNRLDCRCDVAALGYLPPRIHQIPMPNHAAAASDQIAKRVELGS